ncbi:hypothetical protein E2C01_009584 [Portunus trituberculatus]|uniref:Uncharacterized protein n=1 Tax=Portunus trituberculatus TaxID=210409 RepID=A0A5B7D664_PORTR|nr:hypothetical protein [Portunus trituberculatus]
MRPQNLPTHQPPSDTKTIFSTTVEVHHPPQNLSSTPIPSSDSKTYSSHTPLTDLPVETMEAIETFIAQSSSTHSLPDPQSNSLSTTIASSPFHCTCSFSTTQTMLPYHLDILENLSNPYPLFYPDHSLPNLTPFSFDFPYLPFFFQTSSILTPITSSTIQTIITSC